MTNIDSYIGWFGSIPFILYLIVLIRKKIPQTKLILWSITIYLLSIGTGIFLGKTDTVHNMTSAIIAGFIAPVTYSSALYFYYKNRKIIAEDDDDILDH